MLAHFFLGVCVFLSVLLLIVFSCMQVQASVKKYRETFTESAKTNMAEMFIFMEPEKIWLMNVVLVIGSFFFIWLFTGYVVLAIVISLILGASPKFLWSYLRNRRHNLFIRDLPDALNSITSMMKAGTNLNVAMEIMVQETEGPIGQEFGLLLSEIRMGIELIPALDNLVKRMPLQELELVSAAIKINREVGGSLAEVLYRLSNTLRKKLEMDGKIKALTAQGKYQGYVMSLLPVMVALALFQIEPKAMSYLFTHWFGWITCAVFVFFQLIGYFFIKKIVNIDV